MPDAWGSEGGDRRGALDLYETGGWEQSPGEDDI